MITHLSFSELSLGGCICDFLWDVGWVVGFSFPSRVSLVGFLLCVYFQKAFLVLFSLVGGSVLLFIQV